MNKRRLLAVLLKLIGASVLFTCKRMILVPYPNFPFHSIPIFNVIFILDSSDLQSDECIGTLKVDCGANLVRPVHYYR
ncbi:hypothetical protein Q8G35_27670 [Peribacillus simplex]|uniref:Uncharacterized protein n=2 Tax=Peribacillus TaxID=2675229 RepID=A0AA90PLY7_9BACI|nr:MULTISPECIES: hypothetical protein [Peribacillus]MDP1422030.1 hypothetical protein [Peribacillus simplex]MDP1454720.1 hypothetical protein [Peribacillus frigoritolerans]